MNVEDMVSNWNDWADQDPMWAILTDPAKNNGKWNERDFFETGERQISRNLQWLREHGIQLKQGQALDFGCGIGRLSNALAKYFDVVHGVDVSTGMIDIATKLNKNPDKVTFFHNPKANLSDFAGGSYDLVYSEIVLQHIPTSYQAIYIAEFLRLLSDHGIAYFQTVRTVGWRRLVPNWAAELVRRLKWKGRAFIPMYGIPPFQIERICKEADCCIFYHASFPPDQFANRFRCDVYGVTRKTNPQQLTPDRRETK